MLTKRWRKHKIGLRLRPEHAYMLATAAATERMSTPKFILECALERAGELLADRRQFFLDAVQWDAFNAALDAAPRDMPRMTELLHAPSVFSAE